VKKQYFFGYFFARAAKSLAFLVMAIGIGYCVLQYSQANASASATAYQPSSALHRALRTLTETFSATTQTVAAFNADHQLTTPKVEVPHFPARIDSNADFVTVDELLSKVGRDRDALKQSMIGRFEELVKGIELKLRAYAAGVSGTAASPATPSVVVSSSSLGHSAAFDGSVFSPRLGLGDLNKRAADLNAQKEFLKVLETKAENPENRVNLTEAAAQLDWLGKLLPEPPDIAAQHGSTPVSDQSPNENRKVLPSEKVAAQLEQLRADVKQVCLTSWSLDDTFEQAADLSAAEREKCRVATLAHTGIWLSAAARILVALLVAVLASFVILVSADLVKTFLDTASHTGVVADAINAMRGATIIAKNQLRQPWPNGGGHDVN
jgi:hypothetical protein